MRTSHRLPRPIFDAILDLENAVRAEKDLRVLLDQDEETHARVYMEQVCRVGAIRDDLAALILAETGAQPGHPQLVGVVEGSSA